MMKAISSIRVRLTLWYVLLLGAILIAFSAVLYLTLAHSLYQQIDSGLQLAAEQVVPTLNQENGQLSLEPGSSETGSSTLAQRGLLVRIIDLNGRVIDSSGPYRSLPLPPAALVAAQLGQTSLTTLNPAGDATPVRLYSLPYLDNGRVYGVLQVGQSLKDVEDTLRQLLLILALSVPATLVFASLGGLFLANRALSPIDRMTRSAQRISAQDLSQRLDLNLPDDEVGRLARTFDDMLTRLDAAFRRQRQFTADASHELRTPLTIMKGSISVTLNHPRQATEYQRVLVDLDEEVDRLIRLVEDLLLLARADSGQPLLHPEPLDLSDLLRAIADSMRPLAETKGLTLELAVPDRVTLNADPDKLLRLFLNLLDNAVKYTPTGGQVTVRASVPDDQDSRSVSEQQWVVVQVADTGPGIPLEDLAFIFERFYRADEARSRTEGGTGLGLAIARWITEAHGGHIEVSSEPGQGSTFSVWLPQGTP